MSHCSRRSFLKQTSSAIAVGSWMTQHTSAIQAVEKPAMQSKIEAVKTYAIRYPVVGNFKFLKGKDGKPPTRDTVVVKISDDAGNIGWGQSIPSHTWSYETLESVADDD